MKKGIIAEMNKPRSFAAILKGYGISLWNYSLSSHDLRGNTYPPVGEN